MVNSAGKSWRYYAVLLDYPTLLYDHSKATAHKDCLYESIAVEENA